MRLADLRSMCPDDLEHYFAWLHAETLPVGPFAGRAWSYDLPLVERVSRVWQGKEFAATPRIGAVVNRILGVRLFRGVVTLEDHAVVIRYFALPGVVDVVKPFERGRWLGRLAVRGRVVWFTLEATR